MATSNHTRISTTLTDVILLLNRARVDKWGLRIGEVTLMFVKADATSDSMVFTPGLRFIERHPATAAGGAE